jgi:hypothetical protein
MGSIAGRLALAGALLAVGTARAEDRAPTDYFVATTGQGLGIAVDLAARDTTSDRLRAILPSATDHRLATIALVNRTDRGVRVPVLFAAGPSGRVVVLRPPTRWLRGDDLRWWQRQRREPIVIAPGRSTTIYRVAARVGREPVSTIRAWVGGRLVATIEPASR